MFIRFYGHDTYYNEKYPTSDKVIPFKLFRLMYNGMMAAWDFEKLQMIDAINIGIGCAVNPDKPAVKKAIQDIIDNTAGIKRK